MPTRTRMAGNYNSTQNTTPNGDDSDPVGPHTLSDSLRTSVTDRPTASVSVNMPEEPAIDREKHCPFLLRVFFSKGAHNRQEKRIAATLIPCRQSMRN